MQRAEDRFKPFKRFKSFKALKTLRIRYGRSMLRPYSYLLPSDYFLYNCLTNPVASIS